MEREGLIQIIPATGWYVVYQIEEEAAPHVLTEERWPLACWGLFNHFTHGEYDFTAIDGIDMSGVGADGMSGCSEIGGFLRYEHDG